MVTVLYDGLCGLCSKEINYYRRIAKQDCFTWIDVNDNPDFLNDRNITLHQALLNLHACDKHNNWHIGVDAFILIWSHLPKWHIASKIAKTPGVYHALKYIYQLFARWRFKRAAHCSIHR